MPTPQSVRRKLPPPPPPPDEESQGMLPPFSPDQENEDPGPPPEDDERTVGGFAKNVVTSTGNLIGNVVKGVTTELPETLRTIGSVPMGIYEKAGGPLPEGWREDPKSAGHRLDALGEGLKQRYGTWENFKKTAYEDPAGVVNDLSMVIGGVGGAAKAAGMAKTGAALTKAATTINPVVATAKGAKAVVKKGSGMAIDAATNSLLNSPTAGIKQAATRLVLPFGVGGHAIDLAKAVDEYRNPAYVKHEPFRPSSTTARLTRSVPGDNPYAGPARSRPIRKGLSTVEPTMDVQAPEPFKPGQATKRNMPEYTQAAPPEPQVGKTIPRGKFMPPPEPIAEESFKPFKPSPRTAQLSKYRPDTAINTTTNVYNRPRRGINRAMDRLPDEGPMNIAEETGGPQKPPPEAAPQPMPKQTFPEGGKQKPPEAYVPFRQKKPEKVSPPAYRSKVEYPTKIVTEDGVRAFARENGITEAEALRQVTSEGNTVMSRAELNRAVHAQGREMGLDHSAMSDVANQTFKKSMGKMSADELLQMHDAMMEQRAAKNPLPKKGRPVVRKPGERGSFSFKDVDPGPNAPKETRRDFFKRALPDPVRSVQRFFKHVDENLDNYLIEDSMDNGGPIDTFVASHFGRPVGEARLIAYDTDFGPLFKAAQTGDKVSIIKEARELFHYLKEQGKSEGHWKTTSEMMESLKRDMPGVYDLAKDVIADHLLEKAKVTKSSTPSPTSTTRRQLLAPTGEAPAQVEAPKEPKKTSQSFPADKLRHFAVKNGMTPQQAQQLLEQEGWQVA